jgi:hypothetical protein
MQPIHFVVRQSRRDLTAMSGLAFVGIALHRFAEIARRIDPKYPVRQRMVAMGVTVSESVDEMLVPLLKRGRAHFSPVRTGHVPLDLDVFCLDNSGSKKEGVGRTYAGFDGFAPVAAYLGGEAGYCLALELRDGIQHSAKETEYTLERAIPRALALTAAKLLVRWDSGFDSERVVITALNEGSVRLDVLGKWNPCSFDVEGCAADKRKDATSAWESPRVGKRITTWEIKGRKIALADGREVQLRRILRLTERTIKADGTVLLLPEVILDGWETTLTEPIETVIALYAEHGTHEQFHSEFKSDLDLERLPSGKFDTNTLVLSLAAMAYNILRLIGQQSLLGKDAPLRHPAKRRRLKTVMQEMMQVAAQLTEHARRVALNFGRHCPVLKVWRKLYEAWTATDAPALPDTA